MPRYTFFQSTNAQPGVLTTGSAGNAALNHTTPAALANNSPMSANTDAGIFTQIVLKNARGRLLYANPSWVQQQPLQPGHKPKAIMFKFSELDFATASNGSFSIERDPAAFRLAEGVTPENDLKMTVETVEITAEQYGLVMYYTDVINTVSYISFKTMATERLGWGLGRIIDAICKNHLVTSLPALDYATTAEGVGNLSWLRLLRMRTKLEAMDIQPPASEGEFYPLIIHPNQVADLLRDTDIRNAIENSNIGWDAGKNPMVHPARLGEAAGFRFYRTTRCATYDTTTPGGPIDGYTNITVGRDLIAATSLAGGDVGGAPNMGSVYGMGGVDGPGGTYNNNASSPVALIEKPLGSAGTSDPLNQVASIGAKFTFGLKLVQPTYGYRANFTSAYI